MKKNIITYVVILFSLVACDAETAHQSEEKVIVTKEQFGDKWPLTVDSGEVKCLRGSAAVFVHNGTTYQLNGIASSMGFKKIDSIWRDDPDPYGIKINIGPLIDKALSLCS